MREQDPSKGLKAWMVLRDEVVGRLDRYNGTASRTPCACRPMWRFAMSRTARDKAAFSARELTVNFNRRASRSSGINAFYLFFNASSQGAASMVMRFARSKAIRRVCYAIIVSAFLQDMLNRMLAGDDDNGAKPLRQDPRRDQGAGTASSCSQWLEEKGTPYLKWPLPLGYNMFHVAGTRSGMPLPGPAPRSRHPPRWSQRSPAPSTPWAAAPGRT